jgi:hypothetical protein
MPSQPALQKIFAIKVKEKLESDWSDWFDGFQIEENEDLTILKGHVRDQAALYGLLIKMRDLGLTLISVEELKE